VFYSTFVSVGMSQLINDKIVEHLRLKFREREAIRMKTGPSRSGPRRRTTRKWTKVREVCCVGCTQIPFQLPPFLPADDPSIWTNEIPPALIHFQELEERGIATPPDELPPKELHAYRDHQKQLLSMLPLPPTLPRHLEKVILNTTPKELEGTVGGRGGDDNSILPVPNHVVLNHLTASAIKNGTLAVGTTTRYRRKVSG
jgi:hypothetical protein